MNTGPITLSIVARSYVKPVERHRILAEHHNDDDTGNTSQNHVPDNATNDVRHAHATRS